MRTTQETTQPTPNSVLPAFDGFPYLVTRISSAFYHITLLPDGISRQGLWEIAAAQFQSNRLGTSLVLASNRCCYFGDKNDGSEVAYIPRGGNIVTGKLKLIRDFPAIDDLERRRRQ